MVRPWRAEIFALPFHLSLATTRTHSRDSFIIIGYPAGTKLMPGFFVRNLD